MRVYLAGPMSGIRKMNFPAFDAAAADLRSRGYDVVSPAELDSPESRAAALAAEDGDLSAYSRETGETWGDLLARDVKLIADGGIEAIVVLPGWEKSRGARLETFVGRLCALPILNYECAPYLTPVVNFEGGIAHDWEGQKWAEYQDPGPKPESTYNDDASLDERLKRIFPVANTAPPAHMVDLIAKASGLTADEEVRVTDPNTGGQKGQKLCQLGALDPLALMEVGKVAGFGAGKYSRFNFAKGYAWSLSYDALQRHLHQWWAGQDCDDESELSHLGHAAWHCLALLTFVLRERGTDDRLHVTLEEAA